MSSSSYLNVYFARKQHGWTKHQDECLTFWYLYNVYTLNNESDLDEEKKVMAGNLFLLYTQLTKIYKMMLFYACFSFACPNRKRNRFLIHDNISTKEVNKLFVDYIFNDIRGHGLVSKRLRAIGTLLVNLIFSLRKHGIMIAFCKFKHLYSHYDKTGYFNNCKVYLLAEQ